MARVGLPKRSRPSSSGLSLTSKTPLRTTKLWQSASGSFFVTSRSGRLGRQSFGLMFEFGLRIASDISPVSQIIESLSQLRHKTPNSIQFQTQEDARMSVSRLEESAKDR